MTEKMKCNVNYAFRQKAGAEHVHQIYLYDDISKYGDFDWSTWSFKESETSAKHFHQLMDEIPPEDEIELYINSNGGDVDQGTAIYNMLSRHPGKVTAYVDGACHSIAFTIFQAADWRVMGLGTSAIIHNMWMSVSGNAEYLRKCADDLDVFMESCVQLLMKRAKNLTVDQLKEMLNAETVLTPEMALQYGFCDEIGQAKNPAEEPKEDPEQLKQEITELKMQLANQKSFKQELSDFYKTAHGSIPESEQNSPEENSLKKGVDLIGFDAFFKG